MTNKFRIFNKLKETIDAHRNRLSTEGEPPMNIWQIFKNKIQEGKGWWKLWILVVMITFALGTFSDCSIKVEYKYKVPTYKDVVKYFSNKK